MQIELRATGLRALIVLQALVLLSPLGCDNSPRVRYPHIGQGGAGGATGRDARAQGGSGGGFTLPDPPASPGPSAQSADARSCGFEKFTLDRLPASLMLVLDRSSSMGRQPVGGPAGATLWSETLAAVDDVVKATQAGINWGLKLFPVPSGCQVADAPEVAVAPNNHGVVIARAAADGYQTANGRTPTPDAVARAVTYLRTLQDKGNKNIVLATDGEPNCPSSEAAPMLAVQAVRDAAAAGFKTYVIGIAIEPEGIQILNQMAMAGGAPRNDPMFQFYPVSNRADLGQALNAIAGQVASCVFTLSKPPPAPDSVKVTVDGQPAPESATEGWSYTSDQHTAIQLNGSWCERVKTRQQAQVDIVLGCPGIVVP
jgi:hypothetical protein